MASSLHWRTAALPANTALFAVGDIHANHRLLAPLLAAIKNDIAALPGDVQAVIVFLGDYIDRGPDTLITVDMLLAFERSTHASVTFLCGNHDEYFLRFITHRGLVDTTIPGHERPRDLIYTTSTPAHEMYLSGLETWLFVGGGITTLSDYASPFDATLLDIPNARFNRAHPQFSLAAVETLLQQVLARIPSSHREFFARCYAQRYRIVGDYLLTHAGIDPSRSLEAQGIGEGAAPLKGKELIDFLMIRNPFLWRESLPHCPYAVIHGHTPSDIVTGGSIIADGQKDYRLCIDTAAYAPHGAITCFVRYRHDAYFMAVNQQHPDYVTRYVIPPLGQETARQFHMREYPHYHQSTPR